MYVIAQNTERGLVSAKRMSQPVALNPTLYRASGKGPDSPDGQVVLKGVGTGSGGPLLDLGDFRELLEGSGDGRAACLARDVCAAAQNLRGRTTPHEGSGLPRPTATMLTMTNTRNQMLEKRCC